MVAGHYKYLLMTWKLQNHGLEKDCTFSNFKEALAFVNRVGKAAEEMNHHPDILLHDYRHVHLRLITHSAGDVTEKDHALAAAIDGLIKS